VNGTIREHLEKFCPWLKSNGRKRLREAKLAPAVEQIIGAYEEAHRPVGKVRNNRLICPHCGHNGKRGTGKKAGSHQGSGFRYLEDIVNHRHVGEIEDGILKIDSYYETGDGYDDGEDARILCYNCLEEFSLPKDLEIDFE
jgi:hypothetical protein